MRPQRHGLRALTATVAGALLSAFSLALPASAAPLVDADATGSITVHKYERGALTNLPNNGTEVKEEINLDPLADVTFTVQQVNTIDLATNQGWIDAEKLASAFNSSDSVNSITSAGYSLGAAKTDTTTAAGVASFTDLPVGLYLVTETVYPSGVTPAAPFLVTVPLTDPVDTDTWMYDIHVYPKNSVAGIEKTVLDADAVKLGDLVQWTILGDIPVEDVIDGYKIVDPLDSRLDYKGTAVSLTTGVAITKGVDYTIVHEPTTNTVTVEFTDAGRAILAANSDAKVKVIIDTEVNTIGEIENTALVYPNLPSFEIEPGNPGGPPVTPPVVTKWGEITFEKVNSEGGTLAGAEFQLFTSLEDAKAGENAVVIDGADTFTSDADGLLTISGLRYSGWADGEAVNPGDDGYRTYYLVEVKAPNGYELLAEPISFTIDATTSTVGVDRQIVNVPHNAGGELPFTGGSGAMLLYIGGAALVAGAGFLAMRSRRAAQD